MLGLSNSLIGSASPQLPLTPLEPLKLVAWWDFTDTSVMYSDDGSTPITHGSGIYRIDNKAYTLQNNAVTALGAYLEQTDSNNQPAYHSSGKATFDGSDVMFASITEGGTSSNQLSTSSLSGTDLTIFYVTTDMGTSVSADEYLFNANSANALDRVSIYIDNDTNDRWQWHHQNNTARTNIVMNCGQNITNNKELWTVHLDSTSASSFYRNGDTSDGVTNGSADNHTIDLTSTDLSHKTRVALGGKWGGSSFDQYLSGSVVEVIVYNEALSSDNLTLVQNFLLSKHSIS